MNYIIKNNKVYRKGTLAHFLDKRAISIEEPTKEDLPEKINPFQFIRQNLLGSNCAIVKLKHSEITHSTDLLKLLHELTPAEQAILIYIEVDDIKQPVVVSGKTKVEIYPTVVGKTAVPVGITTTAQISPLEERCE